MLPHKLTSSVGKWNHFHFHSNRLQEKCRNFEKKFTEQRIVLLSVVCRAIKPSCIACNKRTSSSMPTLTRTGPYRHRHLQNQTSVQWQVQTDWQQVLGSLVNSSQHLISNWVSKQVVGLVWIIGWDRKEAVYGKNAECRHQLICGKQFRAQVHIRTVHSVFTNQLRGF